MAKRAARLWVGALLASGLATGCGEPAQDPAAGQRPDIALITVESLRADHVSCYGYSLPTTPALDALAEEGVLYERFFTASSWTLASHASLFTGLHPSAHQVALPRDRLGEVYETMAEVLAGEGYQTAAFVSGIYLRRPFNLQQGFEYYDDSPCSPPDRIDEERTSPRMQESIERFFADHRDPSRPLFLFAYYWDVHYAYQPPAPFREMFVPEGAEPVDVRRFDRNPELHPGMDPARLKYLIGQYDGEIRYTDGYLAQLFDLLRGTGRWDRTALIVTSDHGEEFFEHGTKGHKNNLYRESLHVPLILKPPGRGGSRRDSRPASTVDVFPTVLDLAGVDRAGRLLPGTSLLAPVEAEPPTWHELVTTWYFRRPGSPRPDLNSDSWVALRDGKYKLVAVRSGGRRRFELFDLERDPAETRPLGASAGLVLARMQEQLKQREEQLRREAERYPRTGAGELGPEEEALLRSMGYVGGEAEADSEGGPAGENSGK